MTSATDTDWWAAPTPAGPVRATVELPGSKSITNRALILAALADGPSTVTAPLVARDTVLMADALRGLGVRIDVADDTWTLTPAALHGNDVEVGLAGTVMRFVPPVAALAAGDSRFDGDPHARVRPIGTLLDGLRQAGVAISTEGSETLPFTVRGTGSVRGGEVRIDASASSQFVSGLLLAGARYDEGLTVVHQPPAGSQARVPSMPHIDMTVAMLADVGVSVLRPDEHSWQVVPARVAALQCRVEPDLSNAAPFLAAAVVTGGSVTVPHWPATTTQPGAEVPALFEQFGARSELGPAGLTITGTGELLGIDVDLSDVGELTPVIAALCALASGPSRLRGIGHLRGHETDRLAALVTEINNLGGRVREEHDGLSFEPASLHGGRWNSYADHRMAHAGALLGLVVAGIEVGDIATTGKTLPDFAGMWARMLQVS